MAIKRGKSAPSVSFNENVTVNRPVVEKAEETDKKYSLDSDEEDDGARKPNKLAFDEIDGQEKTTRREEDGQRITPFNLEDEEAEGYFAEDGTFIFEKKKEEIRDNWLDTIGIYKVPDNIPEQSPAAREETPDPLSKLSMTEIMEQIVAFLQPSETVSKALKRLGGTQLSASQRLKMKKKGQQPKTSTADKENLEKLTSLADWMLHSGRDTIYQDTFEHLTYCIKQASDDIFGDGEDERESKRAKTESASVEVNWFYKTQQQSELQGPFSSTHMFEMQEKGNFEAGSQCCKETNKDVFYSVARINFDDYID